MNSLTLGNRIFSNNLIQGPLAGYSNAPLRLLTWRYSQPAFSCTEMISSKALIHQPKRSLERYIKKDFDEGPVCFQLSGNDPKELAVAVKKVTDHGADLIDLNCGCPVKKIRRKGMGSSLLTHPKQLAELIAALRNSTHLPISIKIRVEGDSDEATNKQIAKIVNDSGLDYLIVHGRHWTENYDTTCRYEEIKFFVNHVSIPVIGNGDVSCVNSLRAMQATGCAGIMISRAGVGQPWLIKQLLTGNHALKPSNEEIGQIFLEHIERLGSMLLNEKFAIVQARKLIKYYARCLNQKVAILEAVNTCTNLSELSCYVDKYFVTPPLQKELSIL